MAVFNSILLGKVRGSVGNVTTARLKGQGIAKAKITSTTVVNSVTQVASKNRMRNIVLLFQAFGGFLGYWFGQALQTESIYNAFVRNFKTLGSDVANASLSDILGSFYGLAGGKSALVSIDSLVGSANAVTVDFTPLVSEQIQDLKIKVIGFDLVTNLPVSAEHIVTNAEWLAKSANVDLNGAIGLTLAGYAYSQSMKKSSQLKFA